MIIIFKIDDRLSQITDIQKGPSTQSIIQAYAIAGDESEFYTCLSESTIYPLLKSLIYNCTPREVFTRAKPGIFSPCLKLVVRDEITRTSSNPIFNLLSLGLPSNWRANTKHSQSITKYLQQLYTFAYLHQKIQKL